MRRFLWISGLVLTLAGMILTGVLTQAHFTGSIGRICAEGQGCGEVLHSDWSQVAGLPTAFYGFLYYLISFLAFLAYPIVDRENKSLLDNGFLGWHLSAFVISVLLSGYALFGLGTTCFFCNLSLTLVTLLMGGTVFWYIRKQRSTPATPLSGDLWQTATVIFLMASLVFAGIANSRGPAALPGESDQNQRELTALASDAHSIGNPQAPIRVVEFFDLACSHCQRFTLNTFPKIRRDYIDTGKVLWTFRSFPITRAHPNSLYAHGVLSLIPHNDFLTAKKTIMSQPQRWKGRHTRNPRPYFELLLKNYGLNDVSGPSKVLLRDIRQRTRDFAELGIRQTPSFIVNGTIHKGALPYRRWQSIFDRLLSKTNR